MEWFKVSALLPTDPKWKALGLRAKVAFVEWMCEIAQHETDGLYHAAGKPPSYVAELLEAGLVVERPGGYYLPAWLKWNPSRAELQAKRDAARERSAKSRRESRVTDSVRHTAEVEVEVEVEPRSKGALHAVPTKPDADQGYLLEQINERWGKGGNLSFGALQRFNKRYGLGVVTGKLRELHGFPPEEAVRSAYAYLASMLEESA